MDHTSGKHLPLKIALALLPAIILSISYGLMAPAGKAGWAFVALWAVTTWSVWQFTEKNHIIERHFRLTEIAFFLLPISAIIASLELGSKAIRSTTNQFEQAGAAIGTAIGGAFITGLFFVIGIVGGIIMHLITTKYDKKAEASGSKQLETLSNKHGLILSLIGFIIVTMVFGTIAHGTSAASDIPSLKTPTVTTPATPKAPRVDINDKVTFEITKKDFSKINYQDFITMEVKLTNKTDKDIRGVAGTVTYYDIFDKEIKRMDASYDKGLPKNSEKIWNATVDFNQFMANDLKLKDTELKNLKYTWSIDTIIYEDGTKEVPPSFKERIGQ